MLLEQVGIIVDWNKRSGGYMEGKSRPAALLTPWLPNERSGHL